PEQVRLDRAQRQVQQLDDLPITQVLLVTQDDHHPLHGGQARQRLFQHGPVPSQKGALFGSSLSRCRLFLGLDAIQGDGGRALPVVADVSSRSRANPSGRPCWHRRTMSLSAATVSPSPPSSARPYRRFRLVIHGKPAKGFSRLPARKKF